MTHALGICGEWGYESPVRPVAKILQKLMCEKKVGIKDLMRLTGTSRPTVSRHVNDVTEPDLEQREAYAKALGLAPAEFERLWQQEQAGASDGRLSPEVYAILKRRADKLALSVDDYVKRLIRPSSQAARRRGRRAKGDQEPED